MKTFLFACAGKLPDVAKAIGLEYLPASTEPHPMTGKVDNCHPHLRLSPKHDSFLVEVEPGLWLCYADSTEQDTAAVLKAHITKAAHKDIGAPVEVHEYLNAATTARADKLAPVPEGKSERALAVCAAGDDPVKLCKADAVAEVKEESYATRE